MSGKALCLFWRELSDGLRFPPQISHEETAPFRQSHPKNSLALIPLSVLFLYCIQIRQKLLRKVSYYFLIVIRIIADNYITANNCGINVA